MVEVLRDYIDKHSGPIAEAAQAGLAKLEKYKLDVAVSKLPFIATFFNPACKMNYFEVNYKKNVNRKIRKEISEYFSTNYDNQEKNNKRRLSEVDSDDELFAHMFKRSKVDNVGSEIERYSNIPLSNKDVDTVEYWK